MGALFYRERTGEGQFIDIALLDSIMPLMGWVVANLIIGGQQPVLMGNDNFTAAPSGVFRTKDGFINIAANKQEQWEAVSDVVGTPELKNDPRFQERDSRKKNRKELTPLLEAKLTLKDTEQWVEELNRHDVPAGAILTLDQAMKQQQLKHRKAFNKVKIKDIGEFDLFNMTAKFSKTPGFVETPPPALGQHTNEVLNSIGYSKEEMIRLKEAKVI
jgi:formyl-CoA transferase